jgi:outer membrane receptor protein involved in Fe transport
MTKLNKKLLTRQIALLLAAAAPTAAWTQTTQTPDGVDDSQALGTIIVTAEKRSEDIQEVPMSISVIGEDELANLHATQLTDFAGYIPGFIVQDNGAPGQATLALRGIPPISAGSTVATYIDETPLGSSSNYGAGSNVILDLLPYDFQSFEVLRGPQGTLYGATSLGGLVRYTTKAPDADRTFGTFGADVSNTSGASDAGFGAHGAFNLALSPGKLALSASAAHQDIPGFIDNVRTGEKDQNDATRDAGRFALRWTPTADLAITLQAMTQRTDSDSSSVVALDPVTHEPIYGKFKDDNYIAEPFKRDVDFYTGTVNWDLGWGDFVSATSYSETDSHVVQDASLVYGVLFPLFGFPEPGISQFTNDLKLYKTTQEFRLASKSDEHFEWLAGVFWTRENSQQNQLASAQDFSGAPLEGLDPLAIAGLPSTYEEYAGFGDITWKFNSAFDITAGARWAHNSQDFAQISSGAILPTTVTPGSSSESVFTYSFTPRFHFGKDSMAYIRIASGYQPGGPNVVLPDVPRAVDASKLTNYELGFKSTFDENRWLIDVALFSIDWKNIQVSATNGVASYLANGGKATSQGLEFQTLYSPVSGLRLGLNAAYTDATLDDDVPSIGGLEGDRLPGIPKWSASATADYTFPVGNGWSGRVGGGLRYIGGRDSDIASSPYALPLDSYEVLDLNADISNDRWTIRLYVRNATDKHVYTNESAIINAGTGEIAQVRGIPLTPRTIGVGFDVRF